MFNERFWLFSIGVALAVVFRTAIGNLLNPILAPLKLQFPA